MSTKRGPGNARRRKCLSVRRRCTRFRRRVHQCGQGEDGVRLPDTYCIKCSKLSVQSGQLSGVDRRLKPPRGRDTHAHAVATVLPPDDAGERHGVAGPRHIGHVQNQSYSAPRLARIGLMRTGFPDLRRSLYVNCYMYIVRLALWPTNSRRLRLQIFSGPIFCHAEFDDPLRPFPQARTPHVKGSTRGRPVNV